MLNWCFLQLMCWIITWINCILLVWKKISPITLSEKNWTIIRLGSVFLKSWKQYCSKGFGVAFLNGVWQWVYKSCLVFTMFWHVQSDFNSFCCFVCFVRLVMTCCLLAFVLFFADEEWSLNYIKSQEFLSSNVVFLLHFTSSWFFLKISPLSFT